MNKRLNRTNRNYIIPSLTVVKKFTRLGLIKSSFFIIWYCVLSTYYGIMIVR